MAQSANIQVKGGVFSENGAQMTQHDYSRLTYPKLCGTRTRTNTTHAAAKKLSKKFGKALDTVTRV